MPSRTFVQGLPAFSLSAKHVQPVLPMAAAATAAGAGAGWMFASETPSNVVTPDHLGVSVAGL